MNPKGIRYALVTSIIAWAIILTALYVGWRVIQ